MAEDPCPAHHAVRETRPADRTPGVFLTDVCAHPMLRGSICTRTAS